MSAPRTRLSRARIDAAAAIAAKRGGRVTIARDGAITIDFGDEPAAREEGEALQAKIDAAMGAAPANPSKTTRAGDETCK